MIEEIKEDNNCIIKAFENHPISIISEQIGNKKIYRKSFEFSKY
jgi:hypothetical protein